MPPTQAQKKCFKPQPSSLAATASAEGTTSDQILSTVWRGALEFAAGGFSGRGEEDPKCSWVSLAMRGSYGPCWPVLSAGEVALAGTSMIGLSGAVVVVAAGREEVRTGCSVVGMVSLKAESRLVGVSD